MFLPVLALTAFTAWLHSNKSAKMMDMLKLQSYYMTINQIESEIKQLRQ